VYLQSCVLTGIDLSQAASAMRKASQWEGGSMIFFKARKNSNALKNLVVNRPRNFGKIGQNWSSQAGYTVYWLNKTKKYLYVTVGPKC
jgi:hypothetical protein